MNKLDQLKINIKCFEMTKAQADIRGKEFTKVYVAFVNLFAGLFKEQSKVFIQYIDTHSILFTPDEGLVIEKSDEFGDIMPGQDFMDSLGTLLISAHKIGQDGTNTEVKAQVDVLIEVKNTEAENYAKNNAGQLISRVNDTTKQEVRDLFSKAWTDNWTVSDIKSAIEEQFTQFSKYRASLIATMEVANAYEVGKKNQFSNYQARFGITGYKRSQTQHDGNVRASHSLNEIDGWIPENTAFSGNCMSTDHAPFDFNCRCVTLRRLMPPETSDIVATQFEDDKSSYLSDKQKKEIVNAVQKFRQKAPYLNKLGSLSDYGDVKDGSAIARFKQSNSTLIINNIGWDEIQMDPSWGVSGSYSGLSAKEAVIYHELGHYLDTFIDKMALTEDSFRGIPYATIHDDLTQVKMALLSKWQSGEIQGVGYPLSVLEEKGYERGMRELFAESVSGYIMGKDSILDEDMKKILDFLFLK